MERPIFAGADMKKTENIKYYEFTQVVWKLTESSGLSKFVMADILKTIEGDLRTAAVQDLERDIDQYNHDRNQEKMEKKAAEDLKKKAESKAANKPAEAEAKK